MRNDFDFERVLIVSDLHGPFLDKKAWRLVLGVLKEFPHDRVLVNGDFLDCTSISDHVKKVQQYWPEVLEGYSFRYELDFAEHEIVRPLRKAAGKKAKIQFRLGNHEARFLHPNRANAEALAEILETCRKKKTQRLEELVGLHKVGATLSYNAQDTLYGTFTMIHGVKTSPMAAKANLLRYGSGTSGHSHRANSFTQVIRSGLEGWYESGCLRTVNSVEYLPLGDKADWCQAFLSLLINRRTGKFFCTTHAIIGGQCEFNGQVFR